MKNANPPPTNNRLVPPAALHAKINQKLHELKVISAFVDSRLESIEQFLNNFANQPNETNTNNLESDDESGETPLVSPFPHSDNDSDDEEVLKELNFRKFTAYLDPFLPMNIISRKAYNTIMVEGLEGTGKNLVSIVRDVYVFVESFTYITDFVVLEEFVESFTYITDFVVLEDIGEFIISDMAEVIFDEKKLGSS
ncbi:hypothetical protein Tco_1019443 [Tanacetum coccineum]|uniref:Uncharacterized protein n=1 Tax=Tanacetum coccineum TaxID=301880 RepID=A0ABQ5FX57_9ASTR